MEKFKGKIVSLNAKFGQLEKFSSQFHKVKIFVAYHGKNRNKTNISKQIFESKLIPTIYGVPIIGEWKEQKEDFGSHGGKLEISDEGIKLIDTTKPYGFIDSSANVAWETVTEDDGSKREYLTVDGFIWTARYPEVTKVLDGKNNHSMELEIFAGDYIENDYLDILDGEFSALCILGEDVEPCFESSRISQFNLDKDSFKQEFSLMVKELKKELNFEGGEVVEVEEKVEQQEDFETTEGVVEVEEVVADDEVVEDSVEQFDESIDEEESDDDVAEDAGVDFESESDKESVSDDSEEIDGEEFTKDEADNNTEVDTQQVMVDDDSVSGEFEKYVKTYEISHDDIRYQLYKKIEDAFNEDVWIISVYDNYAVYENFADGRFYKQEYARFENDISISETRVEVFMKFLTQDEIETLNSQRIRTEQELATLREFKEEYDLEIRKEREKELFNAFSEKLTEKEIEEVKAVAENMTLEEIEKELFVLAGKKVISFSLNKKSKKVVSVPVKKEFKKSVDSDRPYAYMFEDEE